VGEKVRRAIEALEIEGLRVTASIGIVSHDCRREERSDALETLITTADHRMYAAKQGGRNRVVES
jgi:diguanylate cyclase (GGDEF)-like protein